MQMITQKFILSGEEYEPVPGETQYALAPGVVGVLNEAYEGLVEAFEEAEFLTGEQAAPHREVLRRGYDEDGEPTGQPKAAPEERAAALRQIKRLESDELWAKIQASVTLQGATWHPDLRSKINRAVAGRACFDFFTCARPGLRALMMSSQASPRESESQETQTPQESQETT